jgi:hypothetical protein
LKELNIDRTEFHQAHDVSYKGGKELKIVVKILVKGKYMNQIIDSFILTESTDYGHGIVCIFGHITIHS